VAVRQGRRLYPRSPASLPPLLLTGSSMACGACRCYCNAGREAEGPGDELSGASADLENGQRTETAATAEKDPVNVILMSAVDRVTKFVVRVRAPRLRSIISSFPASRTYHTTISLRIESAHACMSIAKSN
jgi:hypothetical protein